MVLEDTFYCLDGDFPSQLQQHYLKTGSDPLWPSIALLEDRKAVIKSHRDFLRAGANIIRTNTLEASVKLFQDKGKQFKNRVHGPHLALEDSAKAVEEAVLEETFCPRKALIAGTLGSYTITYDSSFGEAKKKERDDLKHWHLEKMKRLVVGGVDIFAAEGIPSVEEALAIIDGVDTLSGALCWISFHCKDDQHLASGEKIDDAFKELLKHPAFRFKVEAVGVDRCRPEDVTALLSLLNKVGHSSGCQNVLGYHKIPYVVCPRSRENDMNFIVDHVEEWMSLGANIIGGSIGVTPCDIKRISDAILSGVGKAREKRDTYERELGIFEDPWKSVLDQLKKPSFTDQKKAEDAAQQAFRDIGDGGGLFSRIHSQMEQLIRENNDKILTS